MAEETPPPQMGSFTDSEGGEGRHLVQWLRGSLSAERGARKAAQRNVASLEARLASLERQLQGQKPARSPTKSRLRKSSLGEVEDSRTGPDGGRPRGEETTAPGGAHLERQERRSPGRHSGVRRSGDFEGMSLESAAWRAWQTFSAEMARISDEREARQGALERKVDGLAKQVDSLLPKGLPTASPGQDSGATSSARWEPVVSIAPDYHDVPGTSSSSRWSEISGKPLGARSTGPRANGDRNDSDWRLANSSNRDVLPGVERGEPLGERPNVDSLAIWGGFPSVSGAEARPPNESTDNPPSSGSFSLGRLGRPTHLRTSSEGDAVSWNGNSDPASDLKQVFESTDVTTAGNSTGMPGPVSGDLPAESGRVPATTSEMQHGALYNPLEDDRLWETLMFGGPKGPVNGSSAERTDSESYDVEQALAKIRGHLDRRMLGMDESGVDEDLGMDGMLEDGQEEGTRGMNTRPSQIPYVTLPNTPLHEASALRSQLSRSNSGASSDFR